MGNGNRALILKLESTATYEEYAMCTPYNRAESGGSSICRFLVAGWDGHASNRIFENLK